MHDKCLVVLDREIYFPGQVITGTLELHLKYDKRVREIKLTLLGEGYVQIFHEKQCEPTTEEYIKKEMELLPPKKIFSERDTVLVRGGLTKYPFLFDLPNDIPSSLNLKKGKITYRVLADINLPGAEEPVIDTKTVFIAAKVDLNNLPAHVRKPIYKTEINDIICVVCRMDPVSIRVELPIRAYAPGQYMYFHCLVKNHSKLEVRKISFKILQVFELISKTDLKRKEIRLLKHNIPDSAVKRGKEKNFHVELEIPENATTVNLTNCGLIKMHCELVGKVKLPYPHFDLLITIPFTLGTIALKNTIQPKL